MPGATSSVISPAGCPQRVLSLLAVLILVSRKRIRRVLLAALAGGLVITLSFTLLCSRTPAARAADGFFSSESLTNTLNGAKLLAASSIGRNGNNSSNIVNNRVSNSARLSSLFRRQSECCMMSLSGRRAPALPKSLLSLIGKTSVPTRTRRTRHLADLTCAFDSGSHPAAMRFCIALRWTL